MQRRAFLIGSASLAPLWLAGMGHAADFEITLTDAEWRARLTPAQFAVLRQHKTEKPFSNSLMGESSALLKEKRPGQYLCAGCALPLFDAATKFDSGTGWPSFFDIIPGAIGTQPDDSWLSRRTEVHCRRCGGHQGHVFEDGPAPTGLRYCINGLALTFTAA